MPQWHYLHSTPHRSLAAQILDHVGQRGLRGELVCAAYHQAVLYFALKADDGATGALICPLDRSGEYGRYTTGYCAFPESQLPATYPSTWARCPDPVLAALTPTQHSGATAWRTRCAIHRSALARLGRLSAGSIVRLEHALEVDAVRCRLLQCLDARRHLYRALDGHSGWALSSQPRRHRGARREARESHRGRGNSRSPVRRFPAVDERERPKGGAIVAARGPRLFPLPSARESRRWDATSKARAG